MIQMIMDCKHDGQRLSCRVDQNCWLNWPEMFTWSHRFHHNKRITWLDSMATSSEPLRKYNGFPKGCNGGNHHCHNSGNCWGPIICWWPVTAAEHRGVNSWVWSVRNFTLKTLWETDATLQGYNITKIWTPMILLHKSSCCSRDALASFK